MAQVHREVASNLAKTRALLTGAKKDLQQIQTLQKGLKEVLANFWQAPTVDGLISTPLIWKEVLNLVASGRIVTVSAQAEEALSHGRDVREKTWLADGRTYSVWIARGVVALAKTRDASKQDRVVWKPLSDLCARSFGIGYTDEFVDTIVTELALEDPCYIECLQCLVWFLTRQEQRQFLTSLLHWLSKRLTPAKVRSSDQVEGVTGDHEEKTIAACAALMQRICKANEPLSFEYLISWLAKGPTTSIALHRAVITVLPKDERATLLERVWQTFSDKLYMKHTPVTQQEALMRVLLLCAGVVHQETPMQVFMLAHSSFQTSGVSDRLTLTSPRARFLGMAMGAVISQLVDKPETRMTFDFDKDEQQELDFFQRLLKVDFKFGSIADLRVETEAATIDRTLVPRLKHASKAKEKAKPLQQQQAPRPKPKPKIMVVEDDQDDDDDEDDDFKPMAKADSDASDTDEDATVVRRDKPKAPVYVRDLLTYLSSTSTDDHDAHLLALHTAPSLIRRKAAFGTELLDQSTALATTYASLADTFNHPDFLDLQLAGMVALVVALPKELGPWFASAIWTGEYNISQRVGMLTSIGLAGRELAGHGRDETLAQFNDGKDEDFASERLPDRLHRLYMQDSRLATTAKRLEGREKVVDMLISPTSSIANGTSTTPISRSDKQLLNPTKTTLRPARPRTKLIKNTLASLLTDSLFLPLTTAYRNASGVAAANTKHVLPHFLQTLSLLLTLSAQSTVQLPLLVGEYWGLLMSLRLKASNDGAVLEAVLFGLLTVFRVFGERKRELVEGFGGLVVESMRWVEVVFEKLEGQNGGRTGVVGLAGGEGLGGGGRDEQGQKCRMLAAGVLMAAKEVVETYQRLLMGELGTL